MSFIALLVYTDSSLAIGPRNRVSIVDLSQMILTLCVSAAIEVCDVVST